MGLEALLLERAGDWEQLSRWERSELGKDLRRVGLSYREIMELVPVKKSTLATWCRDIVLTDEQLAEIKERNPSVPSTPRDTQRKRHRIIELIKAQAELEALHLQDDPFWVAGVSLYWGEGFKTRSELGMANADPHALRLFMRWTETYLPPSTGFTARVNLHADNDEPSARKWWATELGLSLSDFYKSYVKPDGTGHRKNHLKAWCVHG